MDFGLLYYHEFESLCMRLLLAKGFGFIESPDGLRDIGVSFLLRAPTGKKWAVVLQHKSPLSMTNAHLRDVTNLIADARDFLGVDDGLLISSGRLPEQIVEYSDRGRRRVLLWDEPVLHGFLNEHADVRDEFSKLLEQKLLVERRVPRHEVKNARVEHLISRLERSRGGAGHWGEFEDLCLEILNYAFMPPFRIPKIQGRAEDGILQRTATYTVRHSHPFWNGLLSECQTRLVTAGFNNHDRAPGGDDVESMRQFLSTNPMRSLGLLCSRLQPSDAALAARRRGWLEYGKLVILLSAIDLKDILHARASGTDPSEILEIQLNEFFTSLSE